VRGRVSQGVGRWAGSWITGFLLDLSWITTWISQTLDYPPPYILTVLHPSLLPSAPPTYPPIYPLTYPSFIQSHIQYISITYLLYFTRQLDYSSSWLMHWHSCDGGSDRSRLASASPHPVSPLAPRHAPRVPTAPPPVPYVFHDGLVLPLQTPCPPAAAGGLVYFRRPSYTPADMYIFHALFIQSIFQTQKL